MKLRELKRIDSIQLNGTVMEDMLRHANEGHPKEICGLLTGIYIDTEYNYEDMDGYPAMETSILSFANNYHPITNVSTSPNQWDYVPHPNEYMDVLKTTSMFDKNSEIELCGIFHTHPNNLGIPSQYDIAGASWRVPYIIYGFTDKNFRVWYWNGKYFLRIGQPADGPFALPSNGPLIVKKVGEVEGWNTLETIGEQTV